MKPSEDQKARFEEIHHMIDEVPKFGNDIPEVDYFARDVAYTYTRPLQNYKNPRGGQFQAGLYPVSANVPLGGQTGATPDGRYAHTPVADGVSPSAGKDVNGPTAAANSVARLDHFIVSNGTLFNQKFHPSALAGREGLEQFTALILSLIHIYKKWVYLFDVGFDIVSVALFLIPTGNFWFMTGYCISLLKDMFAPVSFGYLYDCVEVCQGDKNAPVVLGVIESFSNMLNIMFPLVIGALWMQFFNCLLYTSRCV